MLDLASPHRAFRYSVRSALESLAAIGIPASRIIIRSRGPVAQDGLVISQFPAPREPLHPDVTVELHVAGTGTFYSIPAGMREWDSYLVLHLASVRVVRVACSQSPGR